MADKADEKKPSNEDIIRDAEKDYAQTLEALKTAETAYYKAKDDCLRSLQKLNPIQTQYLIAVNQSIAKVNTELEAKNKELTKALPVQQVQPQPTQTQPVQQQYQQSYPRQNNVEFPSPRVLEELSQRPAI